MANEISSMTQASMPARSPAKDSSLFAKTDRVATSNASGSTAETGKALPSDGKQLPVQGEAQPQQSESQVKLSEAVGQINDYIQTVQRNLSFSMDDENGKTVIRVIDSDSGELIRQIPDEEVLALANYLQDVGKEQSTSGEANRGILFSDTI